jgi:PKD repeat protein
MKRSLFFAFFICNNIIAFGQLSADFSIDPSICTDQVVRITNTSTAATRFTWDFCQGDLLQLPTATKIATASGGYVTLDVELVFDGTNWYGFVTNRQGNSIFRLDFGTDLNSYPQVTDLGNFASLSPWSPGDIEIVKEGNEWFGFVYGESTNILTRIDFGTSLNTDPGALTAEVILTGQGNSHCGLDLYFDGTDKIIVLTNSYSVTTLRLSAIRSVPGPAEIFSTGNLAAVANLGDVKMMNQDGNWYAFAVAYGTQALFRLSYGTDILAAPVVENISGILTSSPYGIDIGVDAGKKIAYLSTIEGSLIRVNLGADLSAAPLSVESLGNLGKLGNMLKIDLVKSGSKWYAFLLTWDSGEIFRVEFPAPDCAASMDFSEGEHPVISYSSGGETFITLTSADASSSEVIHRSLTVSALVAPAVDISNDGICSMSPVNFSLQSNTPLTAVDWNFGDGTASATPSPSKTFSTAGNYFVEVDVVAENGCSNIYQEQIVIYDKPVADFALPADLVCTNREIVFANGTVDNFDGNLSFQWFVGNNFQSAQADLVYSFYEAGNFDIRLVAAIPGCTSEKFLTLENVQTGPVVNFSTSGQCEGVEVMFENHSTGDIAGYQWMADDLEFSNEISPSEVFVAGNYSITLNTVGANGCSSALSKDLIIYPSPVADFETTPALVCTGAPVSFKDISINPSGSTLTEWFWDFGDSDQSGSRDVQHIYESDNEYVVTHSVKTNFGCEDRKEVAIQVNKSPSADFTNTLVCNGKPVTMEATDPDGKSWLWKIGDKIYQVQKPAHTFRNPGEYDVSLRVTAQNGCITSGSRNLFVPVPLQPDFAVEKNCVGNDTKFIDLTTGDDNIVFREWNLNEESIQNSPEVVYTWQQPGEKQIALAVEGASGCSYIREKTVTIVPSPEAAFTSGPAFASPGVPIHFSNTSTYSSAYVWSFDDGSSSADASPDHVFTDVGTYHVKLVASNEFYCSDSITSQIAITSPSPGVSIVGITASDNADGSIRVTVTLENEGNTILENLAVDIDVSGDIILQEVIEGPLPPLARYNLVLGYGLRRSSSLLFLCAESRLPNDAQPQNNRTCIQFENRLLVLPGYPNPVKDYITIEWMGTENENVRISLLNSLGRNVGRYDISSGEGFNNQIIDVQDLEKGIYLLIVEGKSSKTTQHIMVSH